MERKMKFLLMLVILTAIAPMVSADFSYEMRNARPGASEPTISRTWMSDTAFRIEPDPNTVQIINFASGELMVMNVSEKTCQITKFIESNTESLSDPNTSQQNTLNSMIDSIEITRTEEKQIINGHSCVLVKAVIKGGTPIDYWVTKDYSEYGRLLEQVNKNREHLKNHAILQKVLTSYDIYKKIDGFTIRSISKFMRMELVSETTNISQEKIDPKMFLPPDDYKKIETK